MTHRGSHHHEACQGPSEGPAVLNIGAHIGAAVVYTTAALDGLELEIKRQEGKWDGTHKAVRRRPGSLPDHHAVFAALFESLPAGRYNLRIRGAGATTGGQSIEVVGGQVAQTTFRMGQQGRQ
jgi:hypothetical protein